MKKNKLLIILSSLVAIYAIIGFVVLPKILKPQIEKIINENITQKASLEKIEFNPFLLEFSALGLKIFNEKETTIEIEKLFIDFSLAKSIHEQHINFKDLQVINPYINLIQYEDESLNLEKLVLSKNENAKKSEEKPSSDIKFQVYKTVLENAKIKFTKLVKNDVPFRLDIDKLDYTFYDMGTFRNTLASHSLEILLNKNTKLKVKGGLRLAPFEMYGNVDIKNFKPNQFLAYKKNILNFDLNKDIYLNLKFGYKLNTKDHLEIKINNANLDLKNLDIKQDKNSILSLKQFAINDLNLNYPENIVSIDKIYFDSFNSKIVKDKNNQLNFANLIKQETFVETQMEEKIEEKIETSLKEEKPWKVNLDLLSIKDSNINFNDDINAISLDTKNINIKLDKLKVSGNNLSLEKASLKNPSIIFNDKKNNLKLSTNTLNVNLEKLNVNNSNLNVEKAKIETPSLVFNDLKNKMDITTKDLTILATNSSLVDEKLRIDILTLTKPSVYFVNNKNNTSLVAKEISLKINDIYNYKDQIKISKVNLYEPNLIFKDINSKTDILAKNISLNIQEISQSNNKLKILRSSLNKPYISLTLGKQDVNTKKTNNSKEKEVSKIVKKESKKEESDFAFDIGPIKIKDMKMTFEDKNLPIDFKTNITNLNGEFSRLNSNNTKPTKLNLEGKVDEYGYTKITGIVDINDIKLLTDTNLLFKNIAIKNFTPYTGKFIGREIESGKLNLDLKYNIKKSDLKASNQVIISDIKLGENVESPDAVNLPLELAIALLEDSKGIIDIDLPVSGNLDDPQFSIAPIVWKVFTNLILKAATSPFSLLGSLLGIDEEKLKSLEFEYGKSEILASEKESLDGIAKILAKKHKLAIKIKPVYDEIKDKEALQDIKFEQFLIKKMDKIPEGDAYKEALEDLYTNIDGVRNLNEIEEQFTKKYKDGKKEFNKKNYVKYLRKFLASKQKVTNDELVNLSKERIANISKYLLELKKLDKKSIKIEEITKQKDRKLKWAVFNLDVTTK
ncbi:MAG: DUF748 domain-containing protein [Halarcobacter sp.]